MNTEVGHKHPLNQVIREAVDIFTDLGFEVASGPEAETEHYNFDALNIPKDHPARDMWDTFWLKDGRQLRPHTSPVQIRYMEKNKPPFAIIVPGTTYRYEATDATHETQFAQLEALVVGKKVTLGTLKWVLEQFFGKLYGKELKTRLRPSYFPFVEPGFETDIQCFKCGGTGCSLCKQVGWVEFGGSGMVHPSVLEGVGIDPEEWQGFAFGFGLDRIAMLKYGVDDVRLLRSGDLRFVNQF